MGNSALSRAKIAKEDEYYTLLPDIEKEMVHYRDHFLGKTIFLNCDDPEQSNFWQFFSLGFDFLGLKKLIATHYEYDETKQSYMLTYEAQPNTNEHRTIKKTLKGNGDFRSEEAIELLKESDIVVTNPPFSLWVEYVNQLLEYEKDFIIIGNKNSVSIKDVFPLIEQNKIWIGHRPMSSQFLFEVPDHYDYERIDDKGRKLKNISACWYTNIPINKRYEDMILTEFYESNEEYYPNYDNVEGIEVGRVRDIPIDYEGVMGVPITFLNHHNPEQFEIIGITKTWDDFANKKYPKQIQHSANGKVIEGVTKLNDGAVIEIPEPLEKKTYYEIDGKFYRQTYPRILIRNKKPMSKKEALGF